MKNKGITLISLVITIIILLILTGVVIDLVLGEDGLIRRAKEAGKKYNNAVEDEETQLSEMINTIDEMTDSRSGEVIVSEAIWDEITKKATVTITKKTVNSNLQIQYQINSKEQDKWIIGTTISNLSYNDIVYARLWDGVEGGKITEAKIKDTREPEDASIVLSTKAIGKTSEVIANVTLIDNESGVDIENSKWEFTPNIELGKDESKYSNKFNSNPSELKLRNSTPGTYYLHVLTKDIAGNTKETISDAITILEESAWSFGYEGRERTWTVPYTGYYNIYCYGAQGNAGAGWGAEGSYVSAVLGTLRASQALLTKDTTLTIHVGGMGVGESKTNGSNAGGWNDGGSGQWCSIGIGGKDHTYRSCGGGGSSYIKVGGTKVISATGGAGSYTKYPTGTGSYHMPNIGRGGGSTSLSNATGCIWQTGVLNQTSNNNRGSNGAITINLVK